MTKQILTREEVAAFNALKFSEERRSPFWFIARTGFVLTYVLAALFSLVIYPEQVLAKFHGGAPEIMLFMRTYVHFRVAFLCAITPFYVWAYLRGFHFSFVSLSAFVIASTMFLNELVLFYAFANPEAQQSVVTILALRLILLFCLFLNFWEYRRR